MNRPSFRLGALVVLIVTKLLPTLSQGQTLSLFSINDDAQSVTQFYGGSPSFVEDRWTGSYNLGVTGTTAGSSNLPAPGLGSSASGVFFADHNFNALSWDLNGWASGSYNTGLGNSGSSLPTVSQFTGVGASLSFFIDTPFTLNLSSSLISQFTGSGNQGDPVNNGASVRLLAQVLDGVLVNQYLTSWRTIDGSTGGDYSGSFNQGVFRLEFGAGVELSSNIPDAFGMQYSSYDLQMSVQPIPEPSGMLLIGVGTAFLCLRRRRRAGEN